MKSSRRSGFSLLEVLMATGILLGCVVVLARLAAIGRSNVDDAEQLAAAQIICQTKLNEMLAGIVPVMSVHDQIVEDKAGWKYSVEIEPSEHPGVSALRVIVARDLPDDRRGKQFSLVRWIRDPHRGVVAPETLPDALP